MSVTYANRWDASKILQDMTVDQKESVKKAITVRKLLHSVLDRPYNEVLCCFVEKKLNKDLKI